MARFCGSCGGLLRETAAFCGKCGAKSNAIQPVGNELAREAGIPRWALPGGLLVILIAALAAGYWLFLFEPNDGTQLATNVSAEMQSDVALGVTKTAGFDVRAHCAANPNNPGPGEQEAKDIPPEVRAAKADFWRCAGGRVLVCYGGASGRACVQQSGVDPDHLAELESFCQSSPDSFVPNSIAGPGREWRCVGTDAVSEGNSKVDGYGYFTSSWRNLDTSTSQKMLTQTNNIAPKLTTIPGPDTGFSCWYAFDMDGNQIVGVWDHESPDDQFFGINGKRIKFVESVSGDRSVFTSKEGYQVVSNLGREIRGESYYQYTATLWETNTTVKIGKLSMDYALFRFCSDN